MKSLVLGAAVAAMLSGCATSGVSPMLVSDVASSRVYWEDFAGEGYRIKVTRDAGKMGSLCMTQLFVDGKLAAEIGQAESAVFKVAPGGHTLKAAPSLTTSVCRSFYSAPQFQLEVAIMGEPGEVKTYRYGFSASGVPALVPSGQ